MNLKYKIKNIESYNYYRGVSILEMLDLIDEKLESLENMTFNGHMDLEEILYSLKSFLEDDKDQLNGDIKILEKGDEFFIEDNKQEIK
jgi:hypothetical protein